MTYETAIARLQEPGPFLTFNPKDGRFYEAEFALASVRQTIREEVTVLLRAGNGYCPAQEWGWMHDSFALERIRDNWVLRQHPELLEAAIIIAEAEARPQYAHSRALQMEAWNSGKWAIGSQLAVYTQKYQIAGNMSVTLGVQS